MASDQFEAIREKMLGNPLPAGIPALRERMDALGTTFHPPEDVKIEPTTIAGRPAEWHTPAHTTPSRVLIYFHGGGYVSGSLISHRHLVAMLAKATDCRALALDYRLAPEHPFPAALDDATACYHQLLEEGIAPENIAFAGDSAGGGLTLATMLNLREKGTPLPSAAACLSPWTDLAITGNSIQTNADKDLLLDPKGLTLAGLGYLNNQDTKNPLASPLYADLTGLPPMLIQVGEPEMLFDDASRLAENARKANVEVTFEPWPEMFHVWQLVAPVLPEGEQAIQRIAQFFKHHFR